LNLLFAQLSSDRFLDSAGNLLVIPFSSGLISGVSGVEMVLVRSSSNDFSRLGEFESFCNRSLRFDFHYSKFKIIYDINSS